MPQTATTLIIVKAIAHDEIIRDAESHIIQIQILLQFFRLEEQRTYLH